MSIEDLKFEAQRKAAEAAATAAAVEALEAAERKNAAIAAENERRKQEAEKKLNVMKYIEGVRRVADGTGIDLARFVLAKGVAARHDTTPDKVLETRGQRDVYQRAMSQAVFGGGGALIYQGYADEVIRLVRDKTIVGQLGATEIPLVGGSTQVNRESVGVGASYGSSTAVIEPSDLATDAVRLIERKQCALVALPMDFLESPYWTPYIEDFVLNALIRAMAEAEDLAFLRGSGVEDQPLGIFNQIAASHRYEMTAIATAGVPTAAEVNCELGKAWRKLRKAKIPMEKMALIVNPDAEFAIRTARAPDGSDSNPYSLEMALKGTVAGNRLFVTNRVASDEICLLDGSEVIIGRSLNLELDIFPYATYSQSGQIVGGLSSGQAVIRAISKHDVALKHDTAGVHVTGMTWGV